MHYVIINPETKKYWNGKAWSDKDHALVYVNNSITLPKGGMWLEVMPKYPRYATTRFDVV